MTVQELLERVGEHFSVGQVFGEPIERGGVTIVPVAVVAGGGGGGTGGPGDGGSGGGFGGQARGIGVYTVRDGRVRFVPAVDLVALASMALVAACLTHRTRVLRRRTSGDRPGRSRA